MAPEITIRPARQDDVPEVVRRWNEALPFDRLDERRFKHTVFDDPNYDPAGTLVAVGA